MKQKRKRGEKDEIARKETENGVRHGEGKEKEGRGAFEVLVDEWRACGGSLRFFFDELNEPIALKRKIRDETHKIGKTMEIENRERWISILRSPGG